MNSPRLSILTACFNHAHFLRESVESALAQTMPDVEVVIVDDGSSDDTLEVARALNRQDARVHVQMHIGNRGLAAAQNTAMRASTARWCLKNDADDRMMPTYAERILEMTAEHPTANVIFSPALQFGDCKPTAYRYPDFNPRRMIDQFMIPGPAAYRRELWNAVGGIDETLRAGEDWDFWVRAQLIVGLVPVQLAEPLWEYRQHSGPRVSRDGMARIDEIKARMRRLTRGTAQLPYSGHPQPLSAA